MYPINNNLFNLNEKKLKLNENISKEYIDDYYNYLNKLLNEYINNDYIKCKIIILSLSEQIKDFFKNLSQRYKLIIHIYLYQNFDQSILISSTFLSDQLKDFFLKIYFSKTNISILITVFFIYKQ